MGKNLEAGLGYLCGVAVICSYSSRTRDWE